MNRSRKRPWFKQLTFVILTSSLLALTQESLFRVQAQESPQSLFDAGVAAYKLVELTKAEQYLSRAAEILRQTEQADPEARRLSALVHLYLGRVAAVSNQTDEARAQFQAALERDASLVMVTETDPPKIVELFEETKRSMQSRPSLIPTPQAAVEAEPTAQVKPDVAAHVPTPAPVPKKKKKWIWWALGGAAVVTAGILAIGSGSGGSSGDSRQVLTESGFVQADQVASFTVVPRSAGRLDAMVTWQNSQVQVEIRCRDEDNSVCEGGLYNRTSGTTAEFTASVTQQTYMIDVICFEEEPERFTLTVQYP